MGRTLWRGEAACNLFFEVNEFFSAWPEKRRSQAAGVLFDELDLWIDPVARKGPQAMAVDEMLLSRVSRPMLRVYRWCGAWASLGYFGKVAEAREKFCGVELVRRWTGGGLVDHRADWTYTLVVPRAGGLARMRAGLSYRLIHEALVQCLRAEGRELCLGADAGGLGGLCFENPVEFDVLDDSGQKLAGAAQRRGRPGLLHQGSVAGMGTETRAREFAEKLAGRVREVDFFPEERELAALVKGRYGAAEWLERC